jgi:hypothetical protein
MKFHLCTAYGDSSTHFISRPGALPLHGICQGNGACPAFWYAVSIVLVILLHPWQQGLGVTGDALKWEKCSWSLLAYRFVQGKAYIHTPHSFHAEISIQLEDGSLLLIKCVPVSEDVLVVQVVQTLNGKMLPQVKVLLEKAETWATNIQNGWLNRKLAWSCLNTMIWPSLAL